MSTFNSVNLVSVDKKRRRIKQSPADKTFDAMNVAVIGFLLIIIIIPLINLFSLAFSNGVYTITFFPRDINFQSFKYVFSNNEFLRSVINSVILVVIITICSNVFMALAAFALSKRDFPLRKFFLVFFVITMLFSPGIVPSLLLLQFLKLTNTIWSLVVISLLNVFNMLLFKTFFEGVPEEVEEAAKIDGAGGLSMFFKIILPMSTPVLASCCFFTIVGVWNSYSGALIYISALHPEAQPLALYIYNLTETLDHSSKSNTFVSNNRENIRSATIVLSIIPILAIYPYVIRYIKSGLSVGSVKG